MRYSREELIMIRQQVERSEYLEEKVPGAVAYLFAAVLALILSIVGLSQGSDIWAFAVGLAATWCIYRAVAAWSVVVQLGNLPIRSMDDIGYELPIMPRMESVTRLGGVMVQTGRNQYRRPNLTGLMTNREQTLLFAAMATEGQVSRPILERYGIMGLTTYVGDVTRLAAVKRELESCGMLIGNDVPDAVRDELGFPPPAEGA